MYKSPVDCVRKSCIARKPATLKRHDGGYSWWEGRNLFFLVPTPAQLSAYANHELKIIPTPAQLSAYANHGLKN